MITIQDVEEAILRFSEEELMTFRKWFDEYDAQNWDNQFEEDVKSGKFEKYADQAIADFQSGKCKEV